MAHEVTVDEAHRGKTLSAMARVAMPEITWSKARALCETGRAWVDGETEVDPTYRVRMGQTLRFDPTAKKRDIREGLDRSAIAYIDADVVVVHKPAGLLSVPYHEDDKGTLIDQTLHLLRRDKSQGFVQGSLGAVQRLDKDTTGLLVFARNVQAKKHLQQQFREHSITRRYLALVHGAAKSETYETMLIRNRGDGLRGSFGVFRRPKTHKAPKDAQRALTHVRHLQQLKRASLVECELETGRQHQIRIHLSEAGNPLVGEPVYIRDFEGAQIKAPRPMLHAHVLEFTHPRTEERIALRAEPPEDFRAAWQALLPEGQKADLKDALQRGQGVPKPTRGVVPKRPRSALQREAEEARFARSESARGPGAPRKSGDVTPKGSAKNATAKKAPAKNATAKKAPTKKAPTKKAPTKKAPTKKAPTKKAPTKKAPAKKAPAKKAPAKKAPAKKAPAKNKRG